jgi:hypothetical protein
MNMVGILVDFLYDLIRPNDKGENLGCFPLGSWAQSHKNIRSPTLKSLLDDDCSNQHLSKH